MAHVAFALLAVVVVLVGLAGWKVWDNQQNKEKSPKSPSASTSSAQVTAQDSTNTTTSTTTITTDEQVIAALKAYCNANVDPVTTKALVLTVGKAGASQKQVLYSSDKNFAYVNAVCSTDGTTEGSGSAYYFKLVNDTWVFLYRGQESSEEYTKQFNIPSEFN